MGVETDHLITVHQVHSADVVTVDKPGSSLQKADALVTATPGLTLAVLTADCQPVLFSDPQANVVGAAHAGWRGAMAGVLEATVGAMEGIGAARHNIRACVGPTISQAAYEVGPEFLDDFLQEDPGNSRFFAQGNKDRYQFDLPGYGLKKLRDLGIAEATWTGHCTYRDEDRFFSYRRSVHRKEADYGRLISCIKL
jgi:YfiH family protein